MSPALRLPSAPPWHTSELPSGFLATLRSQAVSDTLVRPYGPGLVAWSWLAANTSTISTLDSDARPVVSAPLKALTMALISGCESGLARPDGVVATSGRLLTVT